MLPDQDVTFDEKAKPVEVPFISTGFMAVKRCVFEDLKKDLPLCHKTWTDDGRDTSFWPFYMPFCIPWPEDGFLYLSEDWALCERAKQQGYKLWLDPSIRLRHVGEYPYELEDLFVKRPPPQAITLRREFTSGLLHRRLGTGEPKEKGTGAGSEAVAHEKEYSNGRSHH